MKIYELYLNLIDNPFAIKTYRALEKYYLDNGMLKEAQAFGQLIGLRLQNDTTNNSPPDT